MKLLVLCVALCSGVAVSAPAEPSRVANPAQQKPVAPQPAVEAQAEEGNDARPKRWYYQPGFYDPYYGPGYGYGGVSLDMVSAGSFASPAVAVSGRTRFGPGPQFRTSASLNELLDHNSRQEHVWQHQQWERDQRFRNNYPDVIDTAAYSNHPNNFENRPFNNGPQSPELRTRGRPDLLHSPSGPVPAFAFESGFNPNGRPYPQPYPHPGFH